MNVNFVTILILVTVENAIFSMLDKYFSYFSPSSSHMRLYGVYFYSFKLISLQVFLLQIDYTVYLLCIFKSFNYNEFDSDGGSYTV